MSLFKPAANTHHDANADIKPQTLVPVQVSLSMLHQNNRWLLQLRDDIDGIVAPGCWGLFGGHLEENESAEVALRRELLEEIGWCPKQLNPWLQHRDSARVVHVFSGELAVPLNQLQLLEGQDMDLVSLEEIRRGWIWSKRLQAKRPLAPVLRQLTPKLHELDQAA